MFWTDWLILRVTHQPLELERSKISFLTGRGTSKINKIKRTNTGQRKKKHTWTRTHDLLVVKSVS